MSRISRPWMLMLTAAGLLAPVSAHAFAIGTGFTDDCHETLTLAAFERAELSSLIAGIELPSPGAWQEVSRWVAETHGLVDSDLASRYAAMSLYAGVRSVDTEGKSTGSVTDLREIHGSPDGQHPHCLRMIEDNWDEGNEAAIQGCRKELLASVDEATAYAMRSAAQQTIRVPFTLDFYGRIDLEVWAPAFYLGRAIHTLEDSFSHTIRSHDMHEIWHVMNFVEAIGGDITEKKDGLAHSSAMDECVGEIDPLAEAATDAAVELLEAAAAKWMGDVDAPVETVLDAWLVYAPGCTMANDYCGSPWLATARKRPSGPVLSCRADRLDENPAARWLPWTVVVLLLGRRIRTIADASFAGPSGRADAKNAQPDQASRGHAENGVERIPESET